MNAESTFTSTNGGSLPRITPELLHFESFEHGAPQKAVVMPDGSRAFAHRGHIYAMPEAHWRQFEAYQHAAA